MFERYLLWNLRTDWLKILCEASWGWFLRKLWKLCWLNNFIHFCPFFSSFFSGQFSNAIAYEVCGPIDLKFHVRHPGEGLLLNVMEIILIEKNLQFLLHFFSPIFKCYLLWSFCADWLHILCEASWGGSLPNLWKLCWCSNLSAERQGPWASCIITQEI